MYFLLIGYDKSWLYIIGLSLLDEMRGVAEERSKVYSKHTPSSTAGENEAARQMRKVLNIAYLNSRLLIKLMIKLNNHHNNEALLCNL